MLKIDLIVFSLCSTLLIANFLQDLDYLINFIVTFIFTKQIVKIKKLKLPTFTNLMILLSMHHYVPIQTLLFLIQVSEIILLLLQHTSINIPILSRKLFIIPLVSLLLKPNYSLLGMALIKLFNSLKYSTSLLLLIQFMQLIGFLTYLSIHTNNSQLLFPKISICSSTNNHQTPLNSETAQVIVSGLSMHWLIKKQNNSISHYYSHTKHHGILARINNMITS